MLHVPELARASRKKKMRIIYWSDGQPDWVPISFAHAVHLLQKAKAVE